MAGRLVIDFYDTVMFQLMKCLLLMLPLRKSFLRISYLTDGIIHLLLSAFVFVVLQFTPCLLLCPGIVMFATVHPV